MVVGVVCVMGPVLRGEGKVGQAILPAPTADEIRTAWSRFRGPDGSGISAYTNVPDSWDAASGKNIVWKTAVALPGNSSPVVCGGRVFLTGADKEHRAVFCFDATTGGLLWKQEAPSTPESAEPFKVTDSAGYACSTVATDGRFVAAMFANGDLAAFDLNGKLAWSKSLGVPKNNYGHASSLALCKDLVLVLMDQGNVDNGLSMLSAMRLATGEVVWEKRRAAGDSWSTPIVIEHAGRTQIIVAAVPSVIAYDPKDGAELWRVNGGETGEPTASPVFANGMVYAVANAQSGLNAIKADGKGDVTATHIAWKGEDNLPDICSPLATEKYVYTLSSSGTVTAYDARKGTKAWEYDVDDMRFKSSPSMVGKRLYLIGEEGKGVILEPGAKECRNVGQTDIGEACTASPAFQDGRIFIRGSGHLFCIGAVKK